MSRKQIINPGWARYQRLTYSPAVRKGNLLFISGQSGAEQDPATGKLVVKGDIVAQTKIAYEKIKTILEAAGASMADVVKTVDYITPAGLENYRATAEVRRQYFKDGFPAATGVVVNRLLREGALIEIEAIAVVD